MWWWTWTCLVGAVRHAWYLARALRWPWPRALAVAVERQWQLWVWAWRYARRAPRGE